MPSFSILQLATGIFYSFKILKTAQQSRYAIFFARLSAGRSRVGKFIIDTVKVVGLVADQRRSINLCNVCTT